MAALNAVLAWDASAAPAETHYALAKALVALGADDDAARELAIAQKLDSARRNR